MDMQLRQGYKTSYVYSKFYFNYQIFLILQKCATTIGNELNDELREYEEEVLKYDEVLEQLDNKPSNSKFDKQAAYDELEEMRKEDEELQERLKMLELQCQKVEKRVEEKKKKRTMIMERTAELYKKLRDNHRF